jgi:hypothetical protein
VVTPPSQPSNSACATSNGTPPGGKPSALTAGARARRHAPSHRSACRARAGVNPEDSR